MSRALKSAAIAALILFWPCTPWPAAAVFSEVLTAPDKGIPEELLEKAHCIVIVPDLKTARIRSADRLFPSEQGPEYPA